MRNTTTFARTLLFLAVAVLIGCTGSVETTEDSTQLELEVPKVETGDAAVDANLSTDDDIDIDTPLKGDS